MMGMLMVKETVGCQNSESTKSSLKLFKVH